MKLKYCIETIEPGDKEYKEGYYSYKATITGGGIDNSVVTHFPSEGQRTQAFTRIANPQVVMGLVKKIREVAK